MKQSLAVIGGILTVAAFLAWGIPLYNTAAELPRHYEKSEERLSYLEARDAWTQCMDDCIRGGGAEEFCAQLCRRYLR